jgi:large subunit ribosomal protein L24
MQKLKVGDTVQVISGKEASDKAVAAKRGRVLRIDREAKRVSVEGLRLVKRHLRKGVSQANPEGGVLEIPGTIALSAVAVVCKKCDKPTRVGIRVEGDKKSRFCRKCDAGIDG